MIISVTLSKPVKNIVEILGENYTRIKIKLTTSSVAAKSNQNYFAECFTETQVFHKKFSESELNQFLGENAGKTFKSCVKRTDTEEIQILANKKGKITTLVKKIKTQNSENNSLLKQRIIQFDKNSSPASKKKNHILQEGNPVPFLVLLGIMTAEGRVISSKYDKFRQINRFLEFIDDILEEVIELKKKDSNSSINIVDFGSGKSYLTFAVQYYLTEIKKIDCEVFGLDLKKDVIDYCNSLAQKLNLKNLSFAVGDISAFGEEKSPDIIITLHACDTATDYALNYAVTHSAKAILSVPCCQHEINLQLKKSTIAENPEFEPLLKYGLIKEKFAALLTDAVRAEILENNGYKVQILEFIEESSTPKNLLIRAIKNQKKEDSKKTENSLLNKLGVNQKFYELQKNGMSNK